MNKEQFIESLRAAQEQLTPYQIPGWPAPVYLRRTTVKEARETMKDPRLANASSMADLLKADEYYFERSVARVIRSADGQLLFDANSEAEMAELRAVLDGVGADLIGQLQKAQAALNKPTLAEAEPSGN